MIDVLAVSFQEFVLTRPCRDRGLDNVCDHAGATLNHQINMRAVRQDDRLTLLFDASHPRQHRIVLAPALIDRVVDYRQQRDR